MEINKLLDTYSTELYSIEYKVFLSNHITHGIIALNKLGATEERIQQFIDWYSPKLEKPVDQPDQISLPENSRPDCSNVLGKRISYFPILEYYTGLYKKECNSSLEEFISRYYPKMSDAMGCALLHAHIHLGYGYSVKNPKLVVEGMAYLHHSYAPIQVQPGIAEVSFGSGSTDILEVIDQVRNDKDLRNYMEKEADRPDWMPWYPGNAQKRVNILAKDKGNELASYVTKIKLPSFFQPQSATLADVLKLADWLIDCSIIVYKCAEKKNDFFLLHGVTGAWSLRQILSVFRENQVQDGIACVKLYLILLLSVFMTQDCPDINKVMLEETTSKTWEKIIDETLKSQSDEHVYKLVQVCHERSLETMPDKEDFYKTAALLSMSRPFFG